MKFQVSPAIAPALNGIVDPASVYITVSRSGEMCSPRCSKSSPVLTATMSAAGANTSLKPSAEPRTTDTAGQREDHDRRS
jgi:hypothetical protein